MKTIEYSNNKYLINVEFAISIQLNNSVPKQ